MTYVLMAAVVLLSSFQTLLTALYSNKYPGKKELATPVFGVVECVGVILVTLIFTGFRVALSPTTVLVGVLNGFALFAFNIGIIGGGTRGSFAFLNVSIMFGGIVVPMVYTVLWLHEMPSVMQLISIVVMLVAMVLINYEKSDGKRAGIVYYVMCLLVFLGNGFYSIFLKLQERYDATLIAAGGEKQSMEMVMITYLMMGVLSLIYLLIKEKGQAPKAFKQTKISALFFALAVLVVALAVNVIVVVIPLMNAAVFFTVNAGGVIVLTSIYSIVIFKEKPSVTKVIGLILAAASIVALSL